MKRHKLYTNYISYCARKKEEEKNNRASSWQMRQKKSFNFIETKSISLSLLRITSPKQKEEKNYSGSICCVDKFNTFSKKSYNGSRHDI